MQTKTVRKGGTKNVSSKIFAGLFAYSVHELVPFTKHEPKATQFEALKQGWNYRGNKGGQLPPQQKALLPIFECHYYQRLRNPQYQLL